MDLNDVLKKLAGLSDEDKQQVTQAALDATDGMPWIPSPGPQTDAYFSEADVLLYGGEPGGGKSSLLLGLALTQHQRSLVLRRQYTDLGHLTEEAIKFNGTRNGFNGSPPPKLNTVNGRLLEFFAAAKIGDEQHRQGNPFDLLAVDEATQFARSQILFLMGWLRSTDREQRKRVVLATNPPLTAEGLWITEMFAPWLDPKFDNPAKPGEIRWAVMGYEDKLQWVESNEAVWSEDKNKLVEPKSYTYIPASIADNPYLADTGYDKEIDSMPGEVRSVLMGGFLTTFRDAENQCIPTAWVREAQMRHTPKPPLGVPMCTMGVDCSGGGTDPMIIAPRYDGWYAPMIEIAGKDLPIEAMGKTATGHIVANRQDGALVVLDMGGGYGGSTYEHLIDNEIDVHPYKGAAKVETRTKDRQLKFTNKRTETYWRFREALDPDQEGGSPLMLPDDPKLLADLTAPTFKITPQGLALESKVDVCKRLARSTDRGDAVVQAWSVGAKFMTDGGIWLESRDRMTRKQKPRVLTGRHHKRR